MNLEACSGDEVVLVAGIDLELRVERQCADLGMWKYEGGAFRVECASRLRWNGSASPCLGVWAMLGADIL